MRVLHLLDTKGFAGTERYLLTLCSSLGNAGLACTVGCLSGSRLERSAVESGLHVLPLLRSWNVLGQAGDVARAAGAEGVDLLHAHNGRTAIAAVLASRRCGVPVVATQHFIQPGYERHAAPVRAIYRLLHRVMNKHVSHFIAVSEDARMRMIQREQVPPGRITTVPNGISPDLSRLRPIEDVRAEMRLPADAPVVVCVSRLETEKDVATLVRAMGAVRDRIPSVRCVIAGDGSQRTDLEQLVARNGLGDCVTFVGYVSDALSLIGASDLLVLPSLAEPFGLVLLEAMALGKPLVATDAGGPREIVQDGHTGLLVPPGDPAAMAEAIVGILSDPVLAADMGSKGRERYEACYTAERMARETLEVYRKVLGEG